MGGDADQQGNGTVTEQRVYQLIRQPMPTPISRIWEPIREIVLTVVNPR